MENELEEVLPTEQRLGTSVPVEGKGGKAGPLRPSSSDRGTCAVVNQADMSVAATGTIEMTQKEEANVQETINPFGKSIRIARTPPSKQRNRAKSASDTYCEIETTNESIGLTDEISEKEREVKRKRIETPPENRTNERKTGGKIRGEDKTNQMIDEYKKLVEKMCKQANNLGKIMKEIYNPKKELKEITAKLIYHAEQLQTPEIKEKFQEACNRKIVEIQEAYDTLLKENQNLQRQVAHLEILNQKQETLYPTTNRTTVACEECKKVQKREERRRILTRSDDYASFKEVTEEDWELEVFPRSQETQDCIWEAPEDYNLLLPCNKNIETQQKMVGIAINKFRGKDGLKKQNKGKGEVAMMVYSLGFPDSGGKFSHTSRVIYYPILTDGETDEDVKDEDTYQAIKTVKAHMLENGKTKLAIPEMEGVNGLVLARITEFLFANTEVQILMYKNLTRYIMGTQPIVRTPRNKKTTETASRNKRTKQDALLIKMGDVSYAELLQTVKREVNPDAVGVNVKFIRKTRRGELLIGVQSGTENLKKELDKKIPGISTTMLTNKKVVHIKDLEEGTTEEEVRDALSKETNMRPDAVEVRALRPAYGNTQNATVILEESQANAIIQKRTIRIGWTQCRVLERVSEIKCYRCWELGHARTQCNGPDRENLCLKCGKEGHKAAGCKGKPYCLHCGKEGHQTGSRNCRKESKKDQVERQKGSGGEERNSPQNFRIRSRTGSTEP